MRKPAFIPHEDIQKAIAEFRARGGLIHKLPDQPTVRSAMIHSSRDMKYVAAEPVITVSAPTEAA